jgi:outer membrane protein assembly factor BamA
LRIGSGGLLALRARGFKSYGDFPDFTYFGGNSELRGYDYLQFAGSNAFFGNAELRFPIIDAALTPLGVVGGVRGVFFAGLGGAFFSGQPSPDAALCGATSTKSFEFTSTSTETCKGVIGFQADPITGNPITDINGQPVLVFGPAKTVSGFRLKDGRASYGVGLETFLLGFPVHFDWSWRTLFNKDWEDVIFASSGGSSAFRRARFAVWIGYDF